jgi:hypothetical protein
MWRGLECAAVDCERLARLIPRRYGRRTASKDAWRLHFRMEDPQQKGRHGRPSELLETVPHNTP